MDDFENRMDPAGELRISPALEDSPAKSVQDNYPEQSGIDDKEPFSKQEEEVGENSADDDEPLDPRVKIELETLNAAGDEINRIERELEISRTKYRSMLDEATGKMAVLYKKNPKDVGKCRPYYLLKRESHKAHLELQRAAIQFQHAVSIYQTARETVTLAEEKHKETNDSASFDSAWQETLNHATMKFNASEINKARTEKEHSNKAGKCAELAIKLKEMEKGMPRTIARVKPYFDMKEKLESQLQDVKLNIDDLNLALNCAKMKYRNALETLEEISNDIHERRELMKNLPERTPGVGAEVDDAVSDLPSIDIDPSSITDDGTSLEYKDSEFGSLDSFSLTDGTQIMQNSASEPDFQRQCSGASKGSNKSASGISRSPPVMSRSPPGTGRSPPGMASSDSMPVFPSSRDKDLWRETLTSNTVLIHDGANPSIVRPSSSMQNLKQSVSKNRVEGTHQPCTSPSSLLQLNVNSLQGLNKLDLRSNSPSAVGSRNLNPSSNKQTDEHASDTSEEIFV